MSTLNHRSSTDILRTLTREALLTGLPGAIVLSDTLGLDIRPRVSEFLRNVAPTLRPQTDLSPRVKPRSTDEEISFLYEKLGQLSAWTDVKQREEVLVQLRTLQTAEAERMKAFFLEQGQSQRQADSAAIDNAKRILAKYRADPSDSDQTGKQTDK
jgi:hypothetical protein